MINYTHLIQSLPKEYPYDLREKNHQKFLDLKLTIIVLDDDPTGTQTIRDVPVLTTWGVKEITSELKREIPLFFILTNSRSLNSIEANRLAETIGKNIQMSAQKSGRRILVISRGDSTLRGHYPNEVDALGKGMGLNNPSHIFIPAFFQGGRYTINDIHYVREEDQLIPAGETAFARDLSFGYHSSDLKDYIEEKSAGRIKSSEVISIGLSDLRKYGPDRIKFTLQKLKSGQVCIVNAANQSDLDVFTSGFYDAFKEKTSPVLLRTAASIVPSLTGSPVFPPLSKMEIDCNGKGGVIAIGSYVPMTSSQLDYLKNHSDIECIEIRTRKLLDKKQFTQEANRVSTLINQYLEKDRIVAIFTSRKLIKGNNPEDSLQIINRVSSGIVEIIKGINIRPKFFIAKGGITSSDILTKAFEVKKAYVIGQIIPGVPTWKLNDCPRFPGLLYMPFPGNLGGSDALLKAVQKFI